MLRIVPVGLLAILVSCATHSRPVPGQPPAEHGEPVAYSGTIVPGLPAVPHGGMSVLHERYRVQGLDDRRFTHARWWGAVEPILQRSPHLGRERIGESVEGRAIELLRFGDGPVPVLLWSQMHGDESTASMTLADMLNFFGSDPDHAVGRRISERLTVWMIPMLNPDGAERFQRRNAQGIDVNRDARMLSTPEGRALRETQRRLQPRFGFNLHDQNVRTTVEGTDRIAAIALLAPPFDETRGDDEVRLRAARLAAVMRHAAEPFVAGHISRYDDTYNPRAFGDGMQSWGTSTVLLESGAWHDDPEKQHLRMVNFAMLVTALDAIATGSYADADPAGYRGLPYNGRVSWDLLLRGGTVVAGGMPPYRSDVAVNYADPLRLRGARVADVGDLDGFPARDTLVVDGLFLHVRTAQGAFGLGVPAPIEVRRGAEPTSTLVWTITPDGAPRRADGSPSR